MTDPIRTKSLGAPLEVRGVDEERPAQRSGEAAGAAPAPVGGEYGALRLELSRRQLRLIDAQRYVRQALGTSPLLETDVALEEAASALMRGALGEEPLHDARLAAIVRHALARDESGLSKLIDVIESQRVGFRNEVERAGRDVAGFNRALDGILDQLAEQALRSLGQRAGSSDRAAAMRSILAAGRTLGCGFSTTALYLSFHYDYDLANGFTNEPGLPELVKKVDATGGAIVGVGGAIFDIGSTGSDLIVSVDASPLIADCIHVFTAILLAVDALVEKTGWDDERRAQEVQLRLTRGAHPETIAELERLGLPGRLRDALPSLLDALANKLAGKTQEANPIPQDLWCRSDRQGERVLHLTRLALEGRIVALTADLADPRISDRVNALLRAHGTVAKVVHFSNALDYIADIRGACRAFGGLALHPDAVLTTAVGAQLRDPVEAAEPDGAGILAQLGSSHRPAQNPAARWLGEGKLGDLLHQVAWETTRHVRDLVTWSAKLLMVNGDAPTPTSIEEYRALIDRMVAEAFADPARANEKLLMRLRNLGRLAAYALADDRPPLSGMDYRLPRSFAELAPIADQIDAEFWSKPGRKERFLTETLARHGIEAKMDLTERAKSCRSYEDLRDLELAIRNG